MRVVLIVQARFGSSRLPGKALKPIAGRPMLAHVLERALAVRAVDEVVLATSDQPADTMLAQLGAALGVAVWRGPEADVLRRFRDAAAAHAADVVVRVTGDCPLLAPDVCERVLWTYLAEPYWECVSNDTTCSGYPDGTDCEVVSMAALERAHRMAGSPADREHVTRWLYSAEAHTAWRTVASDAGDWRHLKWSVDGEADYRRVCLIHERLGGDLGFKATLAAAALASRDGEAGAPPFMAFTCADLRAWLGERSGA